MLNPFPHLLDFGFFAPTLLRLAAACVFASMSWRFFKTRVAFADAAMPFIGAPGKALTYIIVVVYAALAAALILGWNTQIAALIGAAAGLKHAWFAGGRYPLYSPRSRSVYVLAAVICLSLMLSGAGALAMDVRL